MNSAPIGPRTGSNNFTHLLGSLMENKTQPTPQPSSKKSAATPDQALPLITTSPLPPAQPIVIPATFKLHLSSPPATSAKTTEEDGDDNDKTQTAHSDPLNLMTVALSTPVVPAPVVAAKPAAERPQAMTALSPVLLETQPPQLAVKSDETPRAPQTQVAFTAKITPAPSNASQPIPPASQQTQAASSPVEAAPVQPPTKDQSAGNGAEGDGDPTPKPTTTKAPSKASNNTVPQPDTNVPVTAQPAFATVIPTAPSASQANTAGPRTDVAGAQPSPEARPTAAALPETSTIAKSEPVRDLSIRIGDSSSNQVDVKIQERAGEVHVAVQSSSPSLTTDLRQQVGDLVGKLDRAGYHAEIMKPAAADASSKQTANTGQDSAPGQNKQQQDNPPQRFARQKRANQSQWLQQMNGSLGPEGIEQS